MQSRDNWPPATMLTGKKHSQDQTEDWSVCYGKSKETRGEDWNRYAL